MDSWYPHYYYVVSLIVASALAASGLLYYFEASRRRLASLNLSSVRLYAILAAFTVGLYAYILYVGNQQFGGFDHSILIDAGWRLASGQVPYVDFICTLPPAFMLGPKAAFLVGGPSWDSLLHLDAIFACVTFVWLYLLLNMVLTTRLLALLSAIWLQCVSTLTTTFWGYNTIASIAGGVFLLSCLVYLKRPKSIWIQLSYVGSLFLLSLMKPNTAAPLILGAIFVLLSNPGNWLRIFLLTAAAFGGSYFVLIANHFSIPLLFASYKTAGESRGGLKSSILLQFTLNRAAFLLIFAVLTWWLLTPFFYSVRWLVPFVKRRSLQSIRIYLLLCLGPIVGALAMLTNGEHKLIDMVLFMIPGLIIFFGNAEFRFYEGFRPAGLLQALYIGLCFGLAAVSVYTSVSRYRVATIGPYFEDVADQQTNHGFFPHLQTGKELVGVIDDTRKVLASSPTQPIFFGPRMEFAYAAFKLPSPKNLPIWWDPGTAFPNAKLPQILSIWEQHRFGTLIFYKDDFTYYGPEFKFLLKRMYTRDDSHSKITVLHLRQ